MCYICTDFGKALEEEVEKLLSNRSLDVLESEFSCIEETFIRDEVGNDQQRED